LIINCVGKQVLLLNFYDVMRPRKVNSRDPNELRARYLEIGWR